MFILSFSHPISLRGIGVSDLPLNPMSLEAGLKMMGGTLHQYQISKSSRWHGIEFGPSYERWPPNIRMYIVKWRSISVTNKREYIVVLVCNGKQQNQARNDLEAFLGEASGKFVVWLWEHLSKNIFLSNTPPGSSNLKDACVPSGGDDKVDEQRVSRSRDIQSNAIGISDNPLFKEGMKGRTPKFSPREISPNAVEASEDFLLTEENIEGVPAQICKKEISENSPATDDSHSEAMKYGSAGVEQSLQFHDQCKKILKKNYSVSQTQFLRSRKREPALRTLQSVITENLHSRSSTTDATGTRLSSRAVTSLPHQTPRQRGNVWDRLGKPCAGNCDVMDEKNYMLGIDIVKRIKMVNNGEGLDSNRLTWVVPGDGASIKSMKEIDGVDNGYHEVITSSHADDLIKRKHGINQTGMHHDACDSRRKRQLGVICPGSKSVSLSHGRDKHLQNEAAFQELQRLTSAKFNHSKSLNDITTEARSSDGLLSAGMPHSFRPPNTVLNPGTYKVSQSQSNREALMTTTTQNLPSLTSSLLAKSDSLNSAESRCNSYKPLQAEVVDVKLRLQQIEMEMCKLRTKHLEMNNDAKVNVLSHSGEQNHFEEDIESRTVFVSNVHFAATKEAISSHFTKCGAVVKVILLTDTVTAQPKGSAYVVFASKESTDKAVALSGTSFFSRTLKVVPKGDLSAGISGLSGLSQLAGKPVPTPNRKGWSIQRPYSSSHRQWRRDLPATAGNLFSAPAGGLGASAAAEQEGVDSGCQQHSATASLTYLRGETGSSKETPAIA